MSEKQLIFAFWTLLMALAHLLFDNYC